MNSDILLPKIIKFGADCVTEIDDVCRALNVIHPFIVTDNFMVECGYLKRITDKLENAGIPFSVFSNVVPDPTTDSINEGLDNWQMQKHDGLIALGGGSAIDTAKAISVLAKHNGVVKDYKAPNPVPESYPLIAIPTTAGTGSEATKVMVITDTKTQEKMMCLGLGLMPSAALVDYKLTLTMPYRLTADTGLDTLCHALEAYVSKKANPFTDPIALSCLAKVAENLPLACQEPENEAAREALMMAATQGGIAFSNSSVTLIHGMSRPIGAAFHVPHGMSNAMLLPAITEFSAPGAKSRYRDAAIAMKMAQVNDDEQTAIAKLIKGLYDLCQSLNVPSPKDYGIAEQDYLKIVDTMAEHALASGSPNNNPIVPDKAEIIQLYRQVYSGKSPG